MVPGCGPILIQHTPVDLAGLVIRYRFVLEHHGHLWFGLLPFTSGGSHFKDQKALYFLSFLTSIDPAITLLYTVPPVVSASLSGIALLLTVLSQCCRRAPWWLLHATDRFLPVTRAVKHTQVRPVDRLSHTYSWSEHYYIGSYTYLYLWSAVVITAQLHMWLASALYISYHISDIIYHVVPWRSYMISG